MDHAEAIELIEEAALEPDGLDRLMAGDAPGAAALAGHLAGCPDCTAALAATRRTTEALRLVAAETPATDLRARTLALVAAVGRPRGDESAAGEVPAGAPAEQARGGWRSWWRTVPRRWAFATISAATLFALLAGGSFVAADLQGQLDRTRHETARLHDLYGEIETALQQPDARLLSLRSENGTLNGALIVDASSSTVAVLSDDLPPPPAGMEYRCWVEVGGQRQPVGRMWFEDGLAYWAGANNGIAGWATGSTFGVSLEVVGQPAAGAPILSGVL